MSNLYNTIKQWCVGSKNWTFALSTTKDLVSGIWYQSTQPILNFKDRIVHVAKWLPVLWKDRDWDYWYILEILKQKIKFQREHIRDYGMHLYKDRDCDNMRIAELLLQRIQDDNYCEVEYAEISAKYPRAELFTKDSNGNHIWNGPSEEEYKELKRVFVKQKYLKNYDYDFLFKHLKKHLEKWWS